MAVRVLYLVRHGEAVDDGPLSPRGREQAELLAERLAGRPISAVHHSPLPRAAQTAKLIGARLPGVPLHESPLVGDYLPADVDPAGLPAGYAAFLAGFTETERAEGPRLARAAVERFTGPVEVDTHELIVTHAFLIAWLVRHALDAPDARWIGLHQSNCALTVLLYRPQRPPELVMFNDMGHLPPALRWTGFPPLLAGSNL
jgi:serine/threonine-protein phosphatase PGAM5